MKNAFKIGMLIFLAIFTLQSCAKQEWDGISMMFQGSDKEQSAIMKSVERFTQETGIKVRLLYTPHDTYTSKLAGYFVNKKLPDIIELDAPTLANLAWCGFVTDVENYIDADVLADMTPSNIAQCTYPIDGKRYAIAQADSTVLLFANRNYLEKIGARIPKSVEDSWTVEEFDEILSKLAALDEVRWPIDIGWSMNIAGSEWGTYAFYEAFVSAGSDIINRKTWFAEGTLNSPENVRVLEYFQKWNANGWIVPKSAGDNTFYNEKRQTAISWNGNWSYATYEASMGNDVVAIPLPNFGHGTVSPNGTWVWGISATSKNKEAAGKLLSYMMKDKKFLDDFKATGAYPALKSFAATCEDYMDEEKMAIAYAQSECAVERPAHPAYPIITIEVANAIKTALNGGDIKAALDKAAKAIDLDIMDNDGYPPFGKIVKK